MISAVSLISRYTAVPCDRHDGSTVYFWEAMQIRSPLENLCKYLYQTQKGLLDDVQPLEIMRKNVQKGGSLNIF